MIDAFSGVLSGSAFAGRLTNPYNFFKPADVGHFLVTLDLDLFMSIENFKKRMDYLYQRVIGSDRMPGSDRIDYPGEVEALNK